MGSRGSGGVWLPDRHGDISESCGRGAFLYGGPLHDLAMGLDTGLSSSSGSYPSPRPPFQEELDCTASTWEEVLDWFLRGTFSWILHPANLHSMASRSCRLQWMLEDRGKGMATLTYHFCGSDQSHAIPIKKRTRRGTATPTSRTVGNVTRSMNLNSRLNARSR